VHQIGSLNICLLIFESNEKAGNASVLSQDAMNNMLFSKYNALFDRRKD